MKNIKYLKLPFKFNLEVLQAEVNNLISSKWIAHYQKLHYQGDWSGIALRNTNGDAENIFISPYANQVFKDTHLLDECPYIKEVLCFFHCPLKSVRLLKLNAGAIIKEHCDAELNFEFGEIRLHIPIITSPEVEFYLEQEKINLNAGECWYMNFNLPHRISNFSKIDRIHLVIDATVNDWVKDLFSSDNISVKKEIEIPEAPYSNKEKKEMIFRFREMNTDVSNQLADELEIQITNSISAIT